MSIRDWEQRKYRRVFEETCMQLETRRATDPTFTIEFTEGLLKTAYIDHGNDWVGRGAVGNIAQTATIAAYEHVLAEWRSQAASSANGEEPAGSPGLPEPRE